MKINLSAEKMALRDSLSEMAEKKLAKFDRYFGEDTAAFVRFRTRREKTIVEISIRYGGTLFRSEEEEDTFQNAMDRSVETLEGQIKKHKTRLEKKIRDGAFSRSVAGEGSSDLYPEEELPLIRTKTFPIKPMSVEEAILQMDLSGHQFFLFLDADTGKTGAVYRRNGGGYGLLLPE